MGAARQKYRWIRGVAALLLVFLFLGTRIPNTMSFIELAIDIALIFVALVCIHFGEARSRLLEVVGWLLLVSLFAWATKVWI
jgi:hypothetical protein